MSNSVVKISLTTQMGKDMACKHNKDCFCELQGHYRKLCDYPPKEQPKCYYYEASLDEVMRLPIYDIKTKEL